MDILWNDPESTLTKWKTPLFENEKIVELPVDQRTITRRCTDRTISFIKKIKISHSLYMFLIRCRIFHSMFLMKLETQIH